MSSYWRASRQRPALAAAAALRGSSAAAVGRETARQVNWGWLPALSLIGALGLLCVAVANSLSSSGVQGAEPLFWLGLFTIVAPITGRLLAARASRPERIGLVLLFGADLYLIKVLQSPFGFTYGDEFMHLFNANRAFESAHLFSANSILPATPLYPGLESATVALMHLAGLDAFGGGLVIIGLARVVMMLALFLLYEQLTHSARSASLACVLYAANANFLFWSAQFSYESLALPLATLVLFLVARRESGRRPAERLGHTVAAVLITTAVVVTHHLASYFLAGTLSLWVILAGRWRVMVVNRIGAWVGGLGTTPVIRRAAPIVTRWVGRSAWPSPRLVAAAGRPVGVAIFAIVTTFLWLTYVANLTLSYLSPVFSLALLSIVKMIAGEQTGRALFQATAGAYVAPLWERGAALSSVLLCLLGLPFGLIQVWRRYLQHPVALLMAGAAVAYFGLLGLRFVPTAWEIANRSSEFLFIGLALVLAVGRFPRVTRARWLVRPAQVVALVVIMAGGLIAGWPPQLRVAQVYQVAVGDQRIEPAGLATARWTLAELGSGHHFAADEANGRYLLAFGEQNVLVGHSPDVRTIFEDPSLSADQIRTLRDTQTEFLMVDRRLVSGNTMAGVFFDHSSRWPLPDGYLLPIQAYAKFDYLPLVSRIFDAGNVVVYDIRAFILASAKP